MKRANDNSTSQPHKRTKASQACQSCRKNKTRCELLDGVPQSGSLRCHRCKVLGATCSFENSSIIHLPSGSNTNAPAVQTIVINDSRCARTTPPPEPQRELPYLTPPNDSPPSISGSEPPSSTYFSKMEPEDLVPSSKIPWGPSNPSNDWTATPLLSIHHLANNSGKDTEILLEQQMKELGVERYTDQRLSDILTEDQVARLLERYNEYYAPWLCLPPSQSQVRTPLLDLVRASAAARGMDPITRRTVLPRMQKLIEETFLNKIMLNSTLSMESVEALMILCCWPPVCSAGYKEQRDPRMLVGSAVGLAMNLNLAQASSLRQEAVAAGSTQLEDITNKARMWLSLTILESSLCIGTGRDPVSRRAERDRSFVDPTSMRNMESARDIRLGYMSEVLSLVEQGCRIRLSSPSDLEKFLAEAEGVMALLKCVTTFSNPLPVVVPYDKFWFEMMALQMHGWRLAFYHHLFREIRTVMHGHNSQSWVKTEVKGMSIALSLGHDAVEAAQAILTIIVAQQDTKRLGSSPDHIFTMVTFAAVWLIVSNFSVYQLSRVSLGWASERLIILAAEKLSQVSQTPNHLPAKCSHLITRLINAWDARETLVKDMPMSSKKCLMSELGSPKQASSLSSRISAERTTMASAAEEQLASDPGYADIGMPTPNPQTWAAYSSDWLMDSQQFWAAFMDNFGTEGDNISQFAHPTTSGF